MISLETPYEGLYIAKSMWREMYDFSENAVLLVLASDYYREEDYIRDYDEFRKLVEHGYWNESGKKNDCKNSRNERF